MSNPGLETPLDEIGHDRSGQAGQERQGRTDRTGRAGLFKTVIFTVNKQ